MVKFTVDYTEERWFSIEIEVDTEEEATEKFWMGECDFENANILLKFSPGLVGVTEKEEVA